VQDITIVIQNQVDPAVALVALLPLHTERVVAAGLAEPVAIPMDQPELILPVVRLD
jgi:hypothetical protein